MKKLLLLLSFCFLFAISGGAELKTYTEDFNSGNIWSIATSNQKKAGTGTFTSSATKFVYKCSWKYSFYYLSSNAILIGKASSYIELPSFNGKLQSVELTTNTGTISTNVQIKVTDSSDNLVVEPKTLDAAGTSFIFEIPTDKQVERGIYRLVVANGYNAQIKKIVFKVEETTAPATQVATPIITPADGSKVEYGSAVTVSSDEGTNLVVSYGNVTAEEVGSNTKTFDLPDENSGITTYTVEAYAVDPNGTLKDSEVAKATYTLYSNKVANIAAFIKAADTANEKVFQNPVTAIYQNGKRLYVKDDSEYLLIYGNTAQTYKNGDVIPAGFSGTYYLFNNNLPELQNPSGFKASTENTGEVAPTVVEIKDISDCHLSEYISLKKVKYDGTNLTDGTNSIAASPLGVTLTSGKTYNVKAFKDVNNVKVVEAEELQYVSDLQISPAFGEIEIGKTITIRCETAGATLNGFLTVGETKTELTAVAMPYIYTVKEEDFGKEISVYAQASLEGYEPSSELDGSYTVVAPTPEAPVFSIEGGYVVAGTEVTVTYEDVYGAKLQLYAGENAVEGTSYTVNETVTLKAVVTNKYGKTAEATVTYMVATPFMVSDKLTVEDTNATENQYVTFEGVQKNGAEYAGKNAKSTYIQLGYNTDKTKGAYGSEIVMTKSIGTVSRIVITWSTTTAAGKNKGVEIFGKQQPYKAGGAQLMDKTVWGWNIATLSYDNRDEKNQTIYDVQYELNGENVPIYYIGIRPTSDGVVYIESIEFIWNDSFEGGAETTYSLAASVSENNFVVLATGNIAVSREDASNGEAVEFDENSIALAKGQTTVDEFQVVNSYTQGGVTYFNLYGGVENMLVNNRHYLAEETFVIDENSASLFYMDVDGYLRYADDNSYYAYNGTSFAKSTDSTGAVKVYSNTTGKTTDVEAVEIEDADAPVEYYNLQGVRVANPQNGLYIVRQGNKVSKQIIR